jgi:hypothetical protein
VAEKWSAVGFETILEATDFDDWRGKLRQVLGNCQVDLRRDNVYGFATKICLSTVGCLSLVELQHKGGQIDLQCLQWADTAVLWIPEAGWMEERQFGPRVGATREWQNGPGQAMWIAPETELRGHTAKSSLGVSILVPRFLLSQLGEQGGSISVLNPFRTTALPPWCPCCAAPGR